MADSVHKTGILLAAFGASSVSGEQTLLEFEHQVRNILPTTPVRWAFTSGALRSKLAKDRVKSDSVRKALVRMHFEKYTRVAVQSLHLINALEYENMVEEALNASQECGIEVSIGKPLLYSDEDVAKTANALLASLPAGRGPKDAVVCMGHGTHHKGAGRYDDLARKLVEKDSGIFIGTLEGEYSLENILPDILNFAPEKVWLFPLLSLVGKHAQIDMAGDTPSSWKSIIEKKGIPCMPVLKGTAEYPHFVAIWLEHLVESLKKLGA